MDRYERILGGLFGVACGDALGGALEFMSKYEIERKYGYLKDIIGGGSRIRKDYAPENMALVRHVFYNLLKNDKGTKLSMRQKKLKAEWSHDYAMSLVFGNFMILAQYMYAAMAYFKKSLMRFLRKDKYHAFAVKAIDSMLDILSIAFII